MCRRREHLPPTDSPEGEAEGHECDEVAPPERDEVAPPPPWSVGNSMHHRG